jgi:hypothetical protein
MRAILPIAIVGGAIASPALAAPLTLKPIVEARLRYEGVDQDGIARNADALTARLRGGIEATSGPFSALVEAEGTLAIAGHYNSTTNGKTRLPTVADPDNIELNRIQLQYRGAPKTVVTLGRQRINLDDQRFVGSVPWRQNEQTFDAVRVESSAIGPVAVDISYSWSDRTIYGIDSPIGAIHGDNIFATAGTKIAGVTVKGFAFLIDQDQATRRQFSSQTYGARAAGNWPIGTAKLALTASYARQSDYAGNPNDYTADYWLGEAGLTVRALTLTAGYEVLGASKGAAFTSFQTPLATLHKFQGWADKFLTTPANGIRDAYASASYGGVKTAAGPVSMLVAYHRFESDRLSQHYGNEWNAQLGLKAGRHVALLAKFADYRADRFATDTRKFWLQLDYTL